MNFRNTLRHSLKARVTFLSLLIFLISVWSLALYAGRMMHEDAQHQLGEQQMSTATLLADQINDELKFRIQALESIAAEFNPALLVDAKRLQAFLENRPLLGKLFNGGYFVTGADATAIASLPLSAGRVGFNYSEQEHVSVVLKQGKPWVGQPHFGKALKSPVFSIAAPVHDAQARVVGVLVGVIDLDKPNFLDHLASAHYGQTGGYQLVARQQRTIVTASRKGHVLELLPAPGVNAQLDRYNAGDEGVATMPDALGQEVLTAVKGVGTANWYVSVYLPTEEAFAHIQQTQQRMLLSAMALSLLVGGLIWLTLRHQLAPLRTTAGKLGAASENGQPIPVLTVSRPDEVGQLIVAFNRLLTELGQRETLLRRGSDDLKKSEQLLLESQNAARIGSYINHLEAGTFECTSTLDGIFGINKDYPHTNQGWVNFMHPDCRQAMQDALLDSINNKKPFDAQYKIVRPNDGVERWMHGLGVIVCDDNGQAISLIGTVQDITERKQVELSLQLEQERLRLAVSATGLALYDWNPQTGVVEFGEHWAAMFGYRADELRSDYSAWLERVHPDDLPVTRKATNEAFRGGTPYVCEYRMRHRDGSWRWILDQGRVVTRDAQGQITRFVGANLDITERKRSEQFLHQQREQLSLLYEASHRLNRTLDLVEIYKVVNDFMFSIASDSSFSISAFDPVTQLITCRAYFMDQQSFDVSTFPPILLEEPGKGTQSVVIRSGQALLINDFQARLKSARTSYFVHDQTHELVTQVDPEEEIVQSALIVPLKVGDQVTGVVQVMSHHHNAFTEDQLKLLESLALHIASAEQNARLYANVQAELRERELAEIALRESEDRYRTAFRISPDAVNINRLADGLYLEVNDGFTRLTGWTREEVLGKTSQEINIWHDFSVRKKLLEALQGDGRCENLQTEFVAKSGKVISALMSAHVMTIKGEPCILSVTRDLTEHIKAEQSRRIAATAFESQQGMFITDENKVILQVNKAFTSITGYAAEEAVGQTPKLFSSGQHDANFYTTMWDNIARTGSWQGEIWNRRKNGNVYPQQLSVSTVRNEFDSLTHYIGSFSDLSSYKAAEEQIQNLAFSDLLTGLPNRTLLNVRMQQAMAASEHRKRQGALMLIDLDNFKTFNDAFGQEQGDLLLQQVGKRLSSCISEFDTVARLGGDDFVVLLTQLHPDKLEASRQAETVAAKILDVLRQCYQLGQSEILCTSSIGISLFGDQNETTAEPLKRSEMAMYQAKSAGGNTLCFFDPQMQVVVSARIALEAGLREALLKKRFLLHYQAQVNDKGVITGVEALLRWHDQQRGMVSPAEFIPLAEETGLILPIGQWVLEAACAQLVLWAGVPDMVHLTMSVNVSARQFHQDNFVDQLLELLQRSKADPHRLKLELTETMLVSNVEQMIAKMTLLQAVGIGFSLDDFGTGYSSLAYLKRLPLDQLKIDQGFVRNILTDADDAAIARMVIAVAQSMGLNVIAEGVETKAQMEFLADLGCHNYQGYLFSRPLPIQEFEVFLKQLY